MNTQLRDELSNSILGRVFTVLGEMGLPVSVSFQLSWSPTSASIANFTATGLTAPTGAVEAYLLSQLSSLASQTGGITSVQVNISAQVGSVECPNGASGSFDFVTVEGTYPN